MTRYIAATVAAVTLTVLIAAAAFAVRGVASDPAAAQPASSTDALSKPSTKMPKREAPSVNRDAAPAPHEPDLDSIDYPLTRSELQQLQAAADDGHQPWRFDPVAVAEAYLRGQLGVEPVMGVYRPSDRFSGEVPYRATPRPSACGCADVIPPENSYLEGAVLVRRLEEPGSVFFVVGQRSEHFSVTSKLRGSILTLAITAEARGHVYATAESLRGGDAIAHDSAEVEAGQRATLTLQLAGIHPPVLVRVIHSEQGGVASIAEFRAERGA
jgi:hypothetical protein